MTEVIPKMESRMCYSFLIPMSIRMYKLTLYQKRIGDSTVTADNYRKSYIKDISSLVVSFMFSVTTLMTGSYHFYRIEQGWGID